MTNQPKPVRADLNLFYGLTTLLVLVFAAALSAVFTIEALSYHFALGLLAFLTLAVLSESYPLNVPMGNAAIGMSGTIYWALIVLFDPFWAAGVAFLGFLISEVFVRRKVPAKAVFNSAQVGLSSLLASLVF